MKHPARCMIRYPPRVTARRDKEFYMQCTICNVPMEKMETYQEDNQQVTVWKCPLCSRKVFERADIAHSKQSELPVFD